MIIKSIKQVGNPIIRKKSMKVVSAKSPKIKKIIKDLTDTMRHSNLVGIAAPQIGQSLRIFVTEIKATKYRKPSELDKLRVFINPKIIWSSKKKVSGYEGCGSVASSGIFGKVSRSTKIIVSASDKNNNEFILNAKGLLARIIEHEYDHL